MDDDTHGGQRLVEIERQRFADQIAAVESRVAALERDLDGEDDSALRFAFAECWRNRERLLAAADGRTPSAVFRRSPSCPEDDDAERRALARDEAAHAADNVLAFLDRFDTTRDEFVRPARWLLRLELEVRDTGAAVDPDEVWDLALELLQGAPDDRPDLVARAKALVMRWRRELSPR